MGHGPQHYGMVRGQSAAQPAARRLLLCPLSADSLIPNRAHRNRPGDKPLFAILKVVSEWAVPRRDAGRCHVGELSHRLPSDFVSAGDAPPQIVVRDTDSTSRVRAQGRYHLSPEEEKEAL